MKSYNLDSHFKIIFGILGIATLLIVGNIIFFIFFFRNQYVSSDISAWGSLGDFFGGILNPLISFFSLILLGYLTFILSKYSNEENRKMNIHLRKLDAFQDLSEGALVIDQYMSAVIDFIDILNSLMNVDADYEDLQKITRVHALEIVSSLDQYEKFLLRFRVFKVHYGHLFEYDFENEDYLRLKVLVSDLDRIIRYTRVLLLGLGVSNFKYDKFISEELMKAYGTEKVRFAEVADNYHKFISKIKSEVEM